MTAYYKVYRSKGGSCDFTQTAQLTSTDPSVGTCSFVNKPAGPDPNPPAEDGGKWCVAKPQAKTENLQANLNYVCNTQGVDCGPIQPGGACYDDDVRARASYAMNSFYQAKGRHDFNCNFSQTGMITISDPSHGACKYISQNNGGAGSTGPKPSQPGQPGQPNQPPAPSTGGTKWCVPKLGLSDAVLNDHINWLCDLKKVDCSDIQGGNGKCYSRAVLPRASYVMDLYYKKNGRHDYDCDFKGSAQLTTVNPSWGKCTYGT